MWRYVAMKRRSRSRTVGVVLALFAACAITAIRVPDSWAAPVGTSGKYSLTYTRVEEQRDSAIVFFTFTNRSTEPFVYTGYTPEGALLGLEYWVHGEWSLVKMSPCGTGLKSYTVPPGGTAQVAQTVYPAQFNRTMRVCLWDEARPREVVWSRSFVVRGSFEK